MTGARRYIGSSDGYMTGARRYIGSSDRHASRRAASPLAQIKDYNFNEGLFHDCVSELVGSGRLGGVLYGKSTFTPAVYAHAQAASVLGFFQQNGVIDYAALTKMQVKVVTDLTDLTDLTDYAALTKMQVKDPRAHFVHVTRAPRVAHATHVINVAHVTCRSRTRERTCRHSTLTASP